MSGLTQFGSKVGTALGKLERAIGAVFGRFSSTVAGGSHHLEPVEIRREILNEIRNRIAPGGRGEYVFPYAEVDVVVYAADLQGVDAADAVLDLDGIAAEVDSLMTEHGCDAAPMVKITVVEDATLALVHRPFRIEWRRRPSAGVVEVARPAALLRVIQGQADVLELQLTRDRTYLGRMKEVTGRNSGLIRRNDLAFAASETSVGRRHGVVVWDAAGGRFRVLNDPENKTGTTIIRDGAVIRCDSVRGVQLQTGDEICLGTARARFEVVQRP